jgi:hypothetical protein
MESIIRDIADTARWVAVFRAEESERADAVFRDPYARRLAGERGEQIASAIEFSRANSWSFVARTYLFDAAIERHVAEGFDTICRSRYPALLLVRVARRVSERGRFRYQLSSSALRDGASSRCRVSSIHSPRKLSSSSVVRNRSSRAVSTSSIHPS